MEIRTGTGSIIVVNDPELAEQYIKHGATEVVKKPTVEHEKKQNKKIN